VQAKSATGVDKVLAAAARRFVVQLMPSVAVPQEAFHALATTP
jgi:hypothetical protein